METARPSFSFAGFDSDSSDENLIKTREERVEVSLPARLIRSTPGISDEIIPVVLTNMSASGIQVVTDQRFSLCLPPFLGARFTVEFFLDAIEIRYVAVEIMRSEKRRGHRIHLGCRFVNLPTEARLALRSAVASRLASGSH